ncbi:MAG: hypothetical protein NUW01_16755 [Gemmatimonadaceae bacterium]|nr:hypothetical protein [Gemmatimonadaceae bacterium]
MTKHEGFTLRRHAPDAAIHIVERRHEWNMGGHCVSCGRDRFGREGLRDDEVCRARAALKGDDR